MHALALHENLAAGYEHLAESAHSGNEMQFRDLLEKLPTGAYTCDPSGLITYYNRHAVAIWGRTPKLNDWEDRFCGSFKLFAAADGTPIRHDQCWMALALQTKQGYNGQEILVQRPDGERRSILAYANPIRDDAGNLLGAVNVIVDITEQKRAENAIRESRDAAEASNRAKDQFLAVLSHELRTPLSPVMMTIAAMENDAEFPIKFRDDMAMVRRNLELEVKLIDDLLDISRAINGKLPLQLQPVHVHDVLRHVLKNCTSELTGKRLSVSTHLDAMRDYARADTARIQQVFSNLLRNAIKFTPAGGNIFVRTWNLEGSGQLCIEIRDTGMGITQDALPRIFEAFDQGEVRMTRQYGGLGLGLSIARHVVELHGGTITANSEGHDQGATFTVTLNTMAGDAKLRSAAAPRASDSQVPATARVLIVEDHLDTARTLARLLAMTGYEVQTAHSVAAALQLAATEPFDVLISDIGLPDATGYDLMSQVKGRYPIKGIAVSGYGTEEDIQRSRDAGFEEHVVKPVNIEELESIIQRLTGTK